MNASIATFCGHQSAPVWPVLPFVTETGNEPVGPAQRALPAMVHVFVAEDVGVLVGVDVGGTLGVVDGVTPVLSVADGVGVVSRYWNDSRTNVP